MSGGDPAAARRFYEDGLTIAKRLADAAPENADYARDLSVSYERLGDLAMSGGDPAAARRYYEDGLTIREAAGRRGARERRLRPRPVGFVLEDGRFWPRASPAQDDRASWWLRADEVLMGMKQRGMFVSAEDEGFLQQIKQKLGLS